MEYIYFGAAIVVACVGLAVTLFLWNKPVLIIYSQIVFCCVMRYLTQQLHFPDAIKYFTDFLTLLLTVQVVLTYKKNYRRVMRFPMLCVGFFALVTLASFFINKESLIFFFWGIRTNFRFFIFFAACAFFLSKKDVGNIMRFLVATLPVNLVVCLFQYFVQGLRDDYIGGLFGIVKGCNAEMNLYLVLICIIIITMFISSRKGFGYTIIVMAMILAIAALSELKMVFLEVAIILLLLVCFSFPNKRAIYITAAGLIGVYGSAMLFLYLYPSWDNFFNIDKMIKYAGEDSYTQSFWSLNRLSALPYIYSEVLTTPIEKLFGFGLGNTDYFLSFVSGIYTRYYNLRYTFFLHALLSMELGILGLLSYCAFLGNILIGAMKSSKLADWIAKPYCLISATAAATAFAMIAYNQSLRMECAYLFFLVLSFAFVGDKEGSQMQPASRQFAGQL